MCRNILPCPENVKTVTGYKYVLTDKHGHHYSPYTGIRYQPGPVSKLKKIGKYSVYAYSNDLLHGAIHNELQHEKRLTGLFEKMSSALHDLSIFSEWNSKKLISGSKYNIVKMTLSGDIYNGIYDENEIQLGNNIDSISIVKTTNL